MARNVPNTGHEKIVSQKKDVQGAQRIRLRRFGMAVATYSVVIAGVVLGHPAWARDMTAAQWVTFIGLGLIGNVVFFFLFYTNVNLRFSDASLTWEQIVYSGLVGHGAAVRVARGASRGVDVLSARFHLWHATPDATSISQRGSMRHGTLRISPGLGIFSRSSGIQVAIRVISVRFVRHLDNMVCFFRRLRVGYEASLAIAQ